MRANDSKRELDTKGGKLFDRSLEFGMRATYLTGVLSNRIDDDTAKDFTVRTRWRDFVSLADDSWKQGVSVALLDNVLETYLDPLFQILMLN